MLTPRIHPLDYQLEYMLDCAVENNNLDAGSRIVLVVYGEPARIGDLLLSYDEQVKRDGSFAEHYRFRTYFKEFVYPQLRAYAWELLAQLDDRRRIGASWVAFNTLYSQLISTAEYLACSAIGDSCEGGYREDFRQSPYDQRWNKAPSRRSARRLRSPRFVRRYVGRTPEVRDLRRLHRDVYAHSGLPLSCSVEDVIDASQLFLEELGALRERSHRANVVGYAKLVAEKLPPESRRAVRAHRRRLQRAAGSAATLLGPRAVNSFIQGAAVRVAGQELVFSARRRWRLDALGHGGLTLELEDKSGATLCHLCLYWEKTPVLDQLAALALAVEAGEELELLSEANVTAVTAEGARHPLISGRRTFAENRENGSLFDRRRCRDQSYWNETRSLWTEAMGVAVVGREWPSLRRVFEREAA